MLKITSPGLPENVVVYGLGEFGRETIDELIAEGISVDFILDRGKQGQVYRDIPVRALAEMAQGQLADRCVVIGLHNHYVNINELHGELRAAGATHILTPINLTQLNPQTRTRPGYWLDPEFDYQGHGHNFARVRDLLDDEKSISLLDAIIRYRQSGDIIDCPLPSTADEYTPIDLPRYKGPLRIVDCGAFTGVAIQKLLKAGYDVESFVAFEPDLENFATLATHNFPIERRLCLPLGTWSTTTQLKFNKQGSMGSHLSEAGNVTVQCIAVDDVLQGETVNLVKLDVEGAEIETLNGMRALVHHQRPNLLLSAYHTPEHLYEIADLIASWQLGYRFHLRVHEYNTFGVVLYCLNDDLLESLKAVDGLTS
jgi:FkbM family methyltransferase